MGSVVFRMLIEAYRKGTSISASKCCGKITTNLIYFPLGKVRQVKGFSSVFTSENIIQYMNTSLQHPASNVVADHTVNVFEGRDEYDGQNLQIADV